MAPDNPKPTDPNDRDQPFKPAVPDLKSEKNTRRYNYEPTPQDEEERLVNSLIERRMGASDKKFGMYIIKGDDEVSQIARSLEAEVFGEFFNNDPDLMAREYGPYEDASLFILVVDQESKKAAGLIRIIENSEVGFKSVVDLPRYWHGPDGRPVELNKLAEENNLSDRNPETTWDIATLAVREGYNKTLVRPALFHGVFKLSKENGIKDWVGIVDEIVINKVTIPSGVHFKVYNYEGQPLPAENYLDAMSLPVYGNVDEIEKGVKETSEEIYDLLGRGNGFGDEYSMPSTTEWRK